MENRLRIENRQVKTMFGVVILFILGHFLRVLLNVSELAHEIHKYEENAMDQNSEKKLNVNCASKLPFWQIVIISWMLKVNFWAYNFPLYFPFRCLFRFHTLWWQCRHPEICPFMWQPTMFFEDYSARNMSNANQCKGPQTSMLQPTQHWHIFLPINCAVTPPNNNWFLCKLWVQEKILPIKRMDLSNLLSIMLNSTFMYVEIGDFG